MTVQMGHPSLNPWLKSIVARGWSEGNQSVDLLVIPPPPPPYYFWFGEEAERIQRPKLGFIPGVVSLETAVAGSIREVIRREMRPRDGEPRRRGGRPTPLCGAQPDVFPACGADGLPIKGGWSCATCGIPPGTKGTIVEKSYPTDHNFV